MYIQSLRLSNFKAFRHASLELTCRGRPGSDQAELGNITVLVGVNGAGKTSLLQALALTILGEELREGGGWASRGLRRHAMKETDLCRLSASLWLHPEDGLSATKSKVQVRITARGGRERISSVKGPAGYEERLLQDAGAALFLAGYGTSRRSERGSSFDPALRNQTFSTRVQRVASLFSDAFTLVPLSSWWRDSHPRHAELQSLVQQLLPMVHLSSSLSGGELLVEHRGVPQVAFTLPDGYRSFLAWVGDLLFRLDQAAPAHQPLADIPGLVLIDEVDLHLHSRWQQTVVATLAATFPRLQFVLTTHSPLVVGSVRHDNLRLIDLVEDQAVIRTSTTETYGLSADQILRSDHVGLRSTRAPAFVKKLDAVRRRAEEGDVEASIRFSRMLALGAGGED